MKKARRNSMLTKEQILASSDLAEREVECPEWGGSVKIRGLSLATRNNIANGATDMINSKIDTEKMQVLTFIESVVEPKFTIADFEALRNKSATAMDRVVKAIYDASGVPITKEQNEDNKKK